MAAPGIIDELLVEQNYLAGKLAGMSEEKLLENKRQIKIFTVYNELPRYKL
jgi:hypothetical protein